MLLQEVLYFMIYLKGRAIACVCFDVLVVCLEQTRCTLKQIADMSNVPLVSLDWDRVVKISMPAQNELDRLKSVFDNFLIEK